MISNSNRFWEELTEDSIDFNEQWFQLEHGAIETDQPCIPIRYVLKGTYVHCNTNAQNVTAGNSAELTPYSVNPSSEINVFVTNVTTGDVNGYVNILGFSSTPAENFVVVENFNPGLFNHEMGHRFGLQHTHDGGNSCPDVWQFNWEWDNNCDGTVDQNDDTCWNAMPMIGNSPPLNGCEDFCEPHPCCNFENQNNNLMTYSVWSNSSTYAAITPCQLGVMVNEIAKDGCDYLVEVGPECPTPSAFIGRLPYDCPACFYLQSSVNEVQYSMKILDANGNILVNTGMVNGQTGKYCVPYAISPSGQTTWSGGFQTGGTYTIQLVVLDGCSEMASDELSFTLPNPCGIASQKMKIVYFSPNPASSAISINYDAMVDGHLTIYAAHPTTSTFYGVVGDMDIQAGNGTIQNLDISNWNTGTNSLIFQFEGELTTSNFIKL